MRHRQYIVSRLLLSIVMLFITTACNMTKYVPDDQYLLNRVYINGDAGSVSHDELMDYVKPTPNLRILGFWRLGLQIYNLSNPEKDNGWNNWLRKIGGSPSIYDSLLQKKSAEQMRLYLNWKGYYDATVKDTMYVIDTKKCVVAYSINAGRVYNIADVKYYVADDSIRPIIMADTAASLINVGDPLDYSVHEAERERISRRLRERGYYDFAKDYIKFIADSTVGDHLVSDSVAILSAVDRNGNFIQQRRAIIDEVNFDIRHASQAPGIAPTDSTTYSGFRLFYSQKPIFHERLLPNVCFIRPGQIYRLSNVELTQRRMSSLKILNSVNITMTEKNIPDSLQDEFRHLSCNVGVVTGVPQSYSIDVEGTNSSGNLGGAVSLGYNHKNLFHNAEVFSFKIRAAVQNQVARDGKQRFLTFESGAEMSLMMPSLISPFTTPDFNRKRNPNTTLTMAYDYQRRPDFTRVAGTAKMSYLIHGSKYVEHTFSPIELNIVDLRTISNEFSEYIKNTYLQYSYRDHFIMSLNYSFVFNQQKAPRLGSAWYTRFSLETAGNVLSSLTQNFEKNAKGSRELFGIEYSQYVKADFELRLHVTDLSGNVFAYRLYGGVGVPYGNSRMLPFEKSYFVGGANSIRAWPVRGLGPGSSKPNNQLSYHNQTSDVRLEANLEYRFGLVSNLEGALFADAGNIWALRRTTDDKDAIISKNFFRQVALGGGLGIRLNYKSFVIRLDAAAKLHDPSLEYGHRWRFLDEPITFKSLNYNFAIGYPF